MVINDYGNRSDKFRDMAKNLVLTNEMHFEAAFIKTLTSF